MKKSDDVLPLLRFENLSGISNLVHFITTRSGGVSLPPYNSLNLGLHTDDNPDHVLTNRKLLAIETGIAEDKFLYASQVHSGDVKIIDKTAVENGVLLSNPRTDATITGLTGICLMVMVADCVPLLLFDPVKRVSAVIHAGWRGTVHKITSNTIRAMAKHFGTDPADILAGIGPSIGPCCYEVGEDVKDFVAQSFGTTKGYLVQKDPSSKPHFDLWYANHKQLTDNGVKPENIEMSELCTRCHSDIFFSSRASGGVTGRFTAGICMLPFEKQLNYER
ncbi:MAG: peptidoglycan editing factor PgeF [Lentimicrobiaceae bacterium]